MMIRIYFSGMIVILIVAVAAIVAIAIITIGVICVLSIMRYVEGILQNIHLLVTNNFTNDNKHNSYCEIAYINISNVQV